MLAVQPFCCAGGGGLGNAVLCRDEKMPCHAMPPIYSWKLQDARQCGFVEVHAASIRNPHCLAFAVSNCHGAMVVRRPAVE